MTNFALLYWKPKMNLDDGLSMALAGRIKNGISQGSKL